MANRPLLFAGTLLCLIGMVVLPVAALNPGAGMGALDKHPIDPGLKEDLWTIHTEHRLGRYDLNVQSAREVITTLDSHGYDTVTLTGILDEIRGKRIALADALEARDRNALKDINQELLQLWKDFRQELRQLIRSA